MSDLLDASHPQMASSVGIFLSELSHYKQQNVDEDEDLENTGKSPQFKAWMTKQMDRKRFDLELSMVCLRWLHKPERLR